MSPRRGLVNKPTISAEVFFDAILAAGWKHGWRTINCTPSFVWRFNDLASSLFFWLKQQPYELTFYLRPERGMHPDGELVAYVRNLPHRYWTQSWSDGIIQLQLSSIQIAEMISELRVDPDDWQRQFEEVNAQVFG